MIKKYAQVLGVLTLLLALLVPFVYGNNTKAIHVEKAVQRDNQSSTPNVNPVDDPYVADVLKKAGQMSARTEEEKLQVRDFVRKSLSDRKQSKEENDKWNAEIEKIKANAEQERAFDANKAAILAKADKNARINQNSLQNLEADEFEPDNSHNQGEKLVHGFWTSKHNIFPAGDADFFYFNGNAGDVIEIVTKTPNPYWASDGTITGPAEGDLDPHLTLYMPDRSIFVANDDGGAGWDAFINIQLPVSGTYFISVESSPLNPTVGDYELGLAFLLPDGSEPDNSMAAATAIGNFQTISGHTIMPQGDVDYFKFEVPVNYTSLKTIVVNTPSALNMHWGLDAWPDAMLHDLDPAVDLLDADGNVIFSKDDRIEPYDPELGYLDTELIYPFLMKGTYYFRVYASPKDLFYTNVGSYEITLEMAFPDAYEPDNTPANANPMANGDVFSDHTIIPMDWDVFVYNGKAGEIIEITVSTSDPCGRLDPILLLWDYRYEPFLLQPAWDQGIGLDAYMCYGPLPYDGPYYFEVGPDMHIGYSQADNVSNYTISLNVFKYPDGLPYNAANAIPIDYNKPIRDQIIPRTGNWWPWCPPISFFDTMPNWFKFHGTPGETITARVTTPFQFRGSCPIWDNDWMDDLNPEILLYASDGTTVLAYNQNINPNNLWDDAQISYTTPDDGIYYLVVQTDHIGPNYGDGPVIIQHSYGRYDIELMRKPQITAIESDRNVGPAPMPVNFFSKCSKWEDPSTKTWIWFPMDRKNIELYGPEVNFCYWLEGSHDVEKKACNGAGCAVDYKEDFIQVYGPTGYVPMKFVVGSDAHEKEGWDNAVDGDTYWWTGVATVRGTEPYAIFSFADGKLDKKINKVRILIDAGVNEEERWVKKFKVETTAGEPILGSTVLTHGGWSDFVIDPPVKADSIKLIVEEPTDGWRQIAEFEVYEDIVLPSEKLSIIEVTTPHLADGLDAALVTLTLVDADGNPIKVYDERDVAFYLEDCSSGNFTAIDAKCKAKGIFKAGLTMTIPGTYEVIGVAHGAVIRNDAFVSFFGHAGARGPLAFVEGSETIETEGWEKAVDGIREGWNGTVTARGNPTFGIFKFDSPNPLPLNCIGLQTDNGFDDDIYEFRQTTNFEILISDDMKSWKSVLNAKNFTGEMKRYYLDKVYITRYIQIILHQPDWTPGGWKQIVELEALFDSHDGFKFAKEGAEVGAIPTEYGISQNYPNPFNPTTFIEFQLPQNGQVSLRVFNMLGQVVATLVDGQMEAGYHTAKWNATDVPSGIYFYRIEAGTFNQSGRMVLLK